MEKKVRIDKLIFEKGLVQSREKAQAVIMAGLVMVNDKKVEKAGMKVDSDSDIRIKGLDQPYVSRGGLKLERAIREFNINVKNRVAMDVGASTGGFTDCLLQHGAAYVFAIDVGYGQLDWKMVSADRVKNIEKTNFRHMPFSTLGTFVDLVVIDVSFISLSKILPNCRHFLKSGGHLIALIKPQFEAGKDNIGKGGVVLSENIRKKVVDQVKNVATQEEFEIIQETVSPISGKKSGNIEFLIHLKKR